MEETTINTVTDTEVTTPAVADRDFGYEEWCDDNRRNEEAELEAMEATIAEDIGASPFHDLTPERHAELMEGFPVGCGWIPVIGYDAGAPKPFTAELRRATPVGPDVAHLGSYLTAECAMLVATCFGRDMVHADEWGSDEWKAGIRSKITYASDNRE